MKAARALFRHAASGLLVVCAVLADSRPASAGECVDAMNAPAITRALSEAHPDNLRSEARYLLGCLDSGVAQLRWRPPKLLPSWRLLRNTRREYRQLGQHPELIQALTRLQSSRDAQVRSFVTVALALYGQPVNHDSLSAAIPDVPSRAMVLAFLGDSTGVRLAIDAYSTSNAKLNLLDALYYHGMPEAVAFIERVAEDSTDAAAADRARWMIQHPFSAKASWRL